MEPLTEEDSLTNEIKVHMNNHLSKLKENTNKELHKTRKSLKDVK
jgi:hypothetical protein